MNDKYKDAIVKDLGVSSDKITPKVLENIRRYAKKRGVDLETAEMTPNLKKAFQNLPNKEGKMSEFKEYVKKGTQLLRPYVPGEDMTGISVSKEDTLEEGGMIAVNRDNPKDMRYVSKEFAKNYELNEPLPLDAPSTAPSPPVRTIDIGTKKYTKVVAIDRPEFGVNHLYYITDHEDEEGQAEIFAEVQFQKGPIKEHGVNGCQHEDLIAIVIDRLKGFQKTEFKCMENGYTINFLKDALYWLNKRTRDRAERGVEGTSNE